MEMSNEEIIRRYKQAKHKPSQIQILADLNALNPRFWRLSVTA